MAHKSLLRCIPIVLLVLFFTNLARAEDIAIFCYYDYKGWISAKNWFPLLDENDKPVHISAQYRNGVYLTPGDYFDSAVSACRKAAGKNDLNFDRIMGATQFAKNMYQGYLGAVTTHYQIIDGDDEGILLREAHKVFNGFDAERLIETDLVDGDKFDHLKKWKANIIKRGNHAKTIDLISSQVLVDLLRSDLTIFKGDKILYQKREGNKLLDVRTNKFDTSKRNDEYYSIEPFEVIERNIDESVKSSVGRSELRRDISMALESRMQGFEAPATDIILSYFQAKLSSMTTPNVKNAGATEHTITITKDSLILETEFNYLVTVVERGEIAIGTIHSHRETEMNLLTGEFSPDRFVLTRR